MSAKPCLVLNRALNKGLISIKSSNVYEEDEKNDGLPGMRVSRRAADVRVLIGHARRNQLETQKKKKRNPLISQNDSESNQKNI